VQTVVHQLDMLVTIAANNKVQGVDLERAPLERVKAEFKARDFESAYALGRVALDELTGMSKPYIWIEGESATVHTFGEVAQNPEASNGAYLRLYTPNPPGHLGYRARYYFDVAEDGTFDVWMAATLPGPGTSPFKWKVNDDQESDPSGTIPAQPFYAGDRFGWQLLGRVNLTKGTRQSLGINVTDRAASSPDYIFAIDAILLTREPFAPNAAVRPMPVLAEAPAPRSTRSAKK
jgi:hypothetical protein